MTLLDHAENELRIAGIVGEMAKDIMEFVSLKEKLSLVVGRGGLADALNLLNRSTLSPLTHEDSEWNPVMMADPCAEMYRNNRDGRVWKNGATGKVGTFIEVQSEVMPCKKEPS